MSVLVQGCASAANNSNTMKDNVLRICQQAVLLHTSREQSLDVATDQTLCVAAAVVQRLWKPRHCDQRWGLNPAREKAAFDRCSDSSRSALQIVFICIAESSQISIGQGEFNVSLCIGQAVSRSRSTMPLSTSSKSHTPAVMHTYRHAYKVHPDTIWARTAGEFQLITRANNNYKGEWWQFAQLLWHGWVSRLGALNEVFHK